MAGTTYLYSFQRELFWQEGWKYRMWQNFLTTLQSCYYLFYKGASLDEKSSSSKPRKWFYHHLKSLFLPRNLLILSLPSRTFFRALWNAVFNLFTSSPTSPHCLKTSSLLGRALVPQGPPDWAGSWRARRQPFGAQPPGCNKAGEQACLSTAGLIFFLLWPQGPRDGSLYFSFPNECLLP